MLGGRVEGEEWHRGLSSSCNIDQNNELLTTLYKVQNLKYNTLKSTFKSCHNAYVIAYVIVYVIAYVIAYVMVYVIVCVIAYVIVYVMVYVIAYVMAYVTYLRMWLWYGPRSVLDEVEQLVLAGHDWRSWSWTPEVLSF